MKSLASHKTKNNKTSSNITHKSIFKMHQGRASLISKICYWSAMSVNH